jgi:hypothetical protein
MIKKTVLNIILFFVIILCPWWLSVALGIALLFYFKNYSEVIVFGLIMDIYYAKLAPSFNIFDYKLTLFFIILYFISHFLKKRLKFYAE